MRIASITMIGQCPDGIDFHVRNLLWALTPEDHIFIITLPNIIQDMSLSNNNRVTYIPFVDNIHESFINFWEEFPEIIKKYSINPEWFLFTEEDILFFARPLIHEDFKVIRSFLPIGGDYRHITVNGIKIHDRVWEGAQLIHNKIVKNAIEFGVNFSFIKQTFLDKNRKEYENEFGGEIALSMYKAPDTMDEFGLYCALVEKTSIEHLVKALHLRGPESLHRQFPEIYRGATIEKIDEIQKKIPYLDIYAAIAFYHTIGLWQEIRHLDWKKAAFETKREIERLLITGHEWMKFHEYSKLDSLRILMN